MTTNYFKNPAQTSDRIMVQKNCLKFYKTQSNVQFNIKSGHWYVLNLNFNGPINRKFPLGRKRGCYVLQ